MTYLALYIESLEARIAAGGTQEAVDKAFAEYNVFNQEAFNLWVAGLGEVTCIACGKRFKPNTTPERNEILCEEDQ